MPGNAPPAKVELAAEQARQRCPPPNNGPTPKRKSSTDAPIRYASGEITVAGGDIASGGFGVPWGHTRSFASRQSVNETIGQGFCWKVQEWSYLLVQVNGSVIIQGGPNSSLWFTPQTAGMKPIGDLSFTPQLGVKQTLTFDSVSNVYRLFDLDGSVTVYDGFTGRFSARPIRLLAIRLR